MTTNEKIIEDILEEAENKYKFRQGWDSNDIFESFKWIAELSVKKALAMKEKQRTDEILELIENWADNLHLHKFNYDELQELRQKILALENHKPETINQSEGYLEKSPRIVSTQFVEGVQNPQVKKRCECWRCKGHDRQKGG